MYNTQRRKYKIPKFPIIPIIDCILLLPIFLFLLSNAPVQAVPVHLRVGHSIRSTDYVTVTIDNPTVGDDTGTMRLYKGGTFPIVSVHRTTKKDREIVINNWRNKHTVGYDDMLDRLTYFPVERKKKMVIQSGRQVLHEQIIKVLNIGEAAGIDRFEFVIIARE